MPEPENSVQARPGPPQGRWVSHVG